jgi:hypothetical protein
MKNRKARAACWHSRLKEIYLLIWCVFATLPIFSQMHPPPSSSASAEARDQSAKREDWLLRGRRMPGEPAAALRYRAYLQKLHLRGQHQLPQTRTGTPASRLSGTPWVSMGPAPLASDASGDGQEDYNWVSGRATAVAIDTADPTGNTVYLGGAYGGIWKSTNAGPLSQSPASVVWTPVADNQPTLAVGALAIQPQLQNPDPTKSVIIVGTGEANSSNDSYYGLGILRSPNAGSTWTLITNDATGTRSFAGMGFSRIAFSTASPNSVVAATASTSIGIIEGLEDPITANLGIYGSSDGGNTWNYANISDAGTVISPASVTSLAYNAAAATFYAAVRYHGFYSSTDGVNWSRLANQPGSGLTTAACPPQTASPSLCPIYRGEIAVVPGRNETYVWYVDANDNDQGTWTSLNGGSTWTQIDDNGITNCGDDFGCGTVQGSYNLELAAVPDGSATDLYAGAINIYKCQISGNSPTCSGAAPNTFLNLTHAYGCPPDFGSIAHVHPAQHALSFQLLNQNSQDLMFFANDGGLYRALDGYTGLTSGTCGIPNSFDSLNQTLGSMTQIVAFAQAATDPTALLAGSQGNGAPAIANANPPFSTTWQSVNIGDNGPAQISPVNEDLWFVSNPPNRMSGVNIFSCASGINCRFQDFQDNQVVSGGTVDGDTGAYNIPYILDPQNPATLLLGTCRMWRGPAAGGTFSVLSHSFETGGDGICTGNEVNLVQSFAAGGAKDSNGNSNVIYAGTSGFGPLLPTTPPGGHVWVSTNVAGGLSNFVDRTGSINPNSFPISGIAVDSSDNTGLTAYVSIMGFHCSHVWQTSNGGISWTDFTANLPDAPANAVLIDPGSLPSNGTVYVGTDVGVFASSTGAASWTEVGPASGQSGFLPNVAVTALEIYNDGSDKYLRASTYGRGIWEYALITTPDFVISMMPNAMTVFGGQPAVFNGQAIALNGYGSQVDLSCVNGATAPPPNCSPSPGSVVPSSSGTPFTLTASGTDGDYLFNLQAAGTDQRQTTHNYGLALHVVDFGLTPPSPSSVTVNEPGSSPVIRFQVTAAGSFSGQVSLSCSGLPSGANCQFSPSNTVSPTSGNPVNVTLTVSASAETATGTSPIVITGNTPGGPEETQPLSLTVTDTADYALSITNSKSQTAAVNSVATFDGVLNALNGYNSLVTFSCTSGATAPPPKCAANPASLTPTPSGASFTVSVQSGVVQNYNFQITGTGSDPSAIKHSVSVAFSTNFTFQISNQSGVQSIAAGGTATYDLSLTPSGSTFPQDVSLACSGLPVESTCAFSPSAISAGKGQTPVTFTITTTAPVLALQKSDHSRQVIFYCSLLPMLGVLLVSAGHRKRSRPNCRRCGDGRLGRQTNKASAQRHRIALALLLLIVIGEIACGGGSVSSGGSGGSGTPGTSPGTYTVTVTATMGSIVNSVPIQLTVN